MPNISEIFGSGSALAACIGLFTRTSATSSSETSNAADNAKAKDDRNEQAKERRLLSEAVSQSSSGKISVDIKRLSKTKKFKEDVETLGEIEKIYRERHGIQIRE